MKKIIILLFVPLLSLANTISSDPQDLEDFETYLNQTIFISANYSMPRSEFNEVTQGEEVELNLELDTKESLFNNSYLKVATDTALASSLIYTLVEATEDKKKHYLVGAAIGGVVTYFAKLYFKGDENEKLKSFLAGAGAALVAAVVKEAYDSTGKGQVELMDALYTAIPGALISLRINL